MCVNSRISQKFSEYRGFQYVSSVLFWEHSQHYALSWYRYTFLYSMWQFALQACKDSVRSCSSGLECSVFAVSFPVEKSQGQPQGENDGLCLHLTGNSLRPEHDAPRRCYTQSLINKDKSKIPNPRGPWWEDVMCNAKPVPSALLFLVYLRRERAVWAPQSPPHTDTDLSV